MAQAGYQGGLDQCIPVFCNVNIPEQVRQGFFCSILQLPDSLGNNMLMPAPGRSSMISSSKQTAVSIWLSLKGLSVSSSHHAKSQILRKQHRLLCRPFGHRSSGPALVRFASLRESISAMEGSATKTLYCSIKRRLRTFQPAYLSLQRIGRNFLEISAPSGRTLLRHYVH